MEIVKICNKHGHLKENEIYFKYNKLLKKHYARCKLCLKEYNQSEKMKESIKRYRSQAYTRNKRTVYQREYRKREEVKIKLRKYSITYLKKPEKLQQSIERRRNYYNNEIIRKKQRLYHKNKSEKLSDAYIAVTLRMNKKTIPSELLEAKRAHLKLKRKLKELKNVNK